MNMRSRLRSGAFLCATTHQSTCPLQRNHASG
ncbi:TPA: hypothetical protein N0F65_000174 [Lagenidium giganteum]|uniref:Uncharacterized protein n=1 Tax=Lagenidium giganteum TaxID=4803 RepID=A0AAV2YTH7_9STRA|nr:TPA: hypothetical protein N0F65_000174 [Lagenidium giganteum]